MKTRLHYLFVVLALFGAISAHADDIIWTNSSSGGSGNWSNPANWNPNRIPETGDTAVITNSGGYFVALDVNATVSGLIVGAGSGGGVQSFDISGPTLTVNGPIQVNPQGQFILNGGAISGAMTLSSNSVLNVIGGNNFFPGLVLTNYGTVNWTNAGILGENGANAQIYNYGLWNAQSDNNFQGGYNGGTSLFDNFGTFVKSGNTGATILDDQVVFNNTGTVDVENGTLDIEGAGTNNGGSFTTAPGATINLYSFAFTNSTTFIGSGSCLVGNASFGGTVSGTLNWITGNLSGALTLASNAVLNTVSGNDSFAGLVLTNYGTVDWTNAALLGEDVVNVSIYNYGLWNAQSDNNFQGGYNGGTSLFDNFGTFVKSGNTGVTTLDSAVVFNNSGAVNVQMGTLVINGGVNNGGAVSIAGNASLDYNNYTFPASMTFTGAGAVVLGDNATVNGVMTATNLQLNNATLIGTNVLVGTVGWNASSATGITTISSNSVLNIVGGNNFFEGYVLTNYGTVNWTNAGLIGSDDANAQIYNYGLWNAESDNNFQGGYNGGTSLFDNFGTFVKSGNTGATTLDSGVVFNNTGAVNVESGTLNVEGSGMNNGGSLTTVAGAIVNLYSFTFTNSTTLIGLGSYLMGNARFGGTIAGTLTWAVGNLSGTLTLASNAVLNTVSGNDFFAGLVLTNYGTVNWTNASFLGENGANVQIYNYGLWNAESDNNFAGGYNGGTSLFDNFGTFLKSGNTGATTLDDQVVFNNSGTVDVQSGTLSLNGSYNLTGGTFQFGIRSLSNYGTISLAGAAVLTGTVIASLQNGYAPTIGNSFSILSYGSESGKFTSTVLPPGFEWTTNYGSTAYTITVAGILTTGQITNLAYSSQSGLALLQFDGASGASYTVLGTTNLMVPITNWIPLGQASPQTGGVFQYVDSQSTNYPQRFYLIRSP